jgi:hypothetical protein
MRARQRGWAISSLFKTLGFVAGLLAASTLFAEPALAKKALQAGRQQHPAWYRGRGDVQVDCVERSFSISVGNPAYPNRLAIWPAPCGR